MWSWIKSAASSAATWVSDNRAAIASTVAAVVVGALVTIAVGAFLVGTGGLGAGLLVGVLAGVAGGAVGSAAGYGAGMAVDEKTRRNASLLGLGKAMLVGALIGGLTGGLAKGLGGGAAQATEQATEQAVAKVTLGEAAKQTAKRAAVNGLAGASLGVVTQGVTNAAENVYDGKPITDDLGRGVIQAGALGGAVGAGTALLEPAAKPLLDKVASRFVKLGAWVAGKSPPANTGVGGLPSVGTSPAPLSETSAAPEQTAPVARAADAPTAEARAPPEPPRTGFVEVLGGEKVPGESGVATDGQPAATDGRPSAGSSEPTAPAASHGTQVAESPTAAEPARQAALDGPLGEEEAPAPQAAPAQVADCAPCSLEGLLSKKGFTRAQIDEALETVKAVGDRANNVSTKALEVGSALHELTGVEPRLSPELKGSDALRNYIKANVPMNESCIVGGSRPEVPGIPASDPRNLGHFVVAENTPEGVRFRDYQAGADGPTTTTFSTHFPDFRVIIPGKK